LLQSYFIPGPGARGKLSFPRTATIRLTAFCQTGQFGQLKIAPSPGLEKEKKATRKRGLSQRNVVLAV